MSDLEQFDRFWNYGDPAATEAKFRELLPQAEEGSDLQLQLLTQIARTHGLRGQFDEATAILDEVEGKLSDETAVARVRYLLERGRSRNSSGQPDKGRDQFLAAWDLAREQGAEIHAVDAAHMLGIVEPHDKQIEWAEKAMNYAEQASDRRAKGWLGPLYNNLGWTYHELGRFDDALETHRKGWEFRKDFDGRRAEKDTDFTPPSRETLIAKWAYARMLRSLERCEESLAMQEELLADWKAFGEDNGFVFEEVAENLVALDRGEEATPNFRRALELLREIDWFVRDEPERLKRLEEMSP
jgi:tetratricopeptide (TPR) repeat protein